jgi:hypothetical protein
MRSIALVVVSLGLGCAPAPCPPFVAAPAVPSATPAPAATVAPPAVPIKVAVLPIEDDELFRDERALVREALAASLRERAPELAIVPLEEVDRGLRSLSKGGARCAFDETSLARRAGQAGWGHTELLHVIGTDGAPESLWVEIHAWAGTTTFRAERKHELGGVARYLDVFANLERKSDTIDILGGLAATGSDRNALVASSITICEKQDFGACKAQSGAWADRAAALAACYVGQDEAADELLLEGGGSPRCELAHVDDLEGDRGKREACLCAAALASAALSSPGRRNLRIRHRAPDLAGRPAPILRAVDATQNLFSEADYARTGTQGVRRLWVDNLDALAAPLSRCAPAKSPLVATLSISEAGRVEAVEVGAGTSPCVEKALRAGRFACSDDGAPAILRVAITWPSVES